MVLPKADWVLEMVPKREAAGFNPRKPDHMVLPKAGWGGARDAELPKGKELLKLGASAGWQSTFAVSQWLRTCAVG